MSEDDEQRKKDIEEFVGKIPDLIDELEPGKPLTLVKEILARLNYVDLFDQEMYLVQIKRRSGIGIGILRKGLKESGKNKTNLPYKIEEDPFWLRIYNNVNAKYGERIKAMSDSRQLMFKRGNIYTPDIKKFTKYLSNVCNEYKTGYRSVRNDVLEKFRDSHLLDRNDFCREPFILNFTNGYYDIIKNEFIKPKDSDKIFFYEIPHEYKEGDYKCPKFEDALHKWLGVGNKVSPRDMFQFMGYTMGMNVGQRKAFLIYGETKSGKTQFYEILKYLIGKENTTDISLQMLGSDKFSSSSLEWKILNYHDELPKEGLNDVSLFKIIAGGGSTFPVRRMHTEWYQAFNTVKLWYNTNIVPMTKATEDDSFFNRWIIINYPNQFIEDNPDPTYEDIPEFYKTIIDDEDEVQGIIHNCIEAIKLLYKNKHFRKELSVKSRKIWEYESDLLYAFLDKYTELEDGEYILCSKFKTSYNKYRQTRHPSRRRPGVTSAGLNKEMDIRGYEKKQLSAKYEDEGKRAYMNVKLNKKWKKDDKNNFKKKSYKTTSDYLEDNPNANMNGNGRPEQHEDMGQIHWAGMNWDDEDKFKGKLIIKKKSKNLD